MEKKQRLGVILSTFGVVMILFGTTMAFFNYTRTGVSNVVKLGRISFDSEQTNTITLLDVFPIDKNTVGSSSYVGTSTINIVGDTTYDDGVEYLLSVSNLTNTIGNKEIPIDVVVSASGIGNADPDYFDNRGPSASTSIYKVLNTGTIENNQELLVGYIKKGSTGVNGTVTIKAYLDKDKVVISDTYPSGTVHTVKTTNYSSSDCETILTGVTNASTYCATSTSLQSAIDNNNLTANQITSLVTAGIVEEYTNGTPASFGEGKVVLTTEEWNSFQTNGVSFQVKVEANEGTWVDDLNRPICIRATSLHTETCSQSSNYCYADGYYSGGTMDTTTITYGNLGTSGNTPTVGDAFDCDTNGDGNYTERFYYVSPYYNTDTLTFDGTTSDDYATLIYYSNTVSGIANDGGSAYDSRDENWHGPVTAKANLPTTSQWSNITLKTIERAILSEDGSTHNAITTGGGTLPTVFSYDGYAARLLTVQELMNGCNLTQVGSFTAGELSTNCKFLMEGTRYADSSKATDGIWTETPHAFASRNAWCASGYYRNVLHNSANGTASGARPVIDVPYSRLDY